MKNRITAFIVMLCFAASVMPSFALAETDTDAAISAASAAEAEMIPEPEAAVEPEQVSAPETENLLKEDATISEALKTAQVTAASSVEAEAEAEAEAGVYPIAILNSEESLNESFKDHTPASMQSENARMFSQTMRYTVDTAAEKWIDTGTNTARDSLNIIHADYNYVNLWIYVETLPTDSDGNPSTLDILFRTTAANRDSGAFYYSAPVTGTGWQLLSIPKTDFSNRGGGTSDEWDGYQNIQCVFLLTNSTVKDSNSAHTATANKRQWRQGGDYFLLDYVYLSKEAPPAALHAAETSVKNGTRDVPMDLGGDNTFTTMMDIPLMQLADSVHPDRITVLKNGQEVDPQNYTVSVDQNNPYNLNLTFASTLSSLAEYEIQLNPGCVYDVYGQTFDTDYAVTFTTEQGEYHPPTVVFTEPDSGFITMEEGEQLSMRISADIFSSGRIRVYVDGTLVSEVEKDFCEYVYTGEVGVHIIEAEAEDETGAVSERSSVTVVVSEQVNISGQFEGGKTGGTYTASAFRVIGFDAECGGGLDRVEFYVNDTLAMTSETAHTDFDFSEYSAGTLLITAVVYDTAGRSASFDFTAQVSLEKRAALWSEDYENYKSGATVIGDNIKLYHKNGYSNPVTIDANHGTSLSLGITTDLGSDSGEYANFANSRGASHIVFETEFYVSAAPETDAAIRFVLIQDSASQQEMFRIASNIYKGSTTMNYTPGTWHTLSVDVDMTATPKRYSVNIDGQNFISNIDLSSEKSTLRSLNYIRCYGPAKAGVPGYIAFDNTSISAYENYGISSISGEDGSELIKSDAGTVWVYLSEGISTQGLNADSVKINGDYGELRVAGVEYDSDGKCVIVTLKDALLAGKSYSVELSENLKSLTGEPLGVALTRSFETANDAPVSINYSGQTNNQLTLLISDRFEEQKEVYIVISAWKGAEYNGAKVYRETLGVDVINALVYPTDFASAGTELQIYIWDSLIRPKMLINDIYTVKK